MKRANLKFLVPLLALSAAAVAIIGADLTIPHDRLAGFQPLPLVMSSSANPATVTQVNLGRMLYYDTRLSADHKVSCNTCHLLEHYGTENSPVSTGFRGQAGNRNSPTVYNAAGQLAQFWDGRAADVEAQAKGPVTNPVEMAMSSPERVVATLNSIPGYVTMFHEAFPGETDPVTFDNMAAAIGAFERGLVTPSRWDRFLEGDQSALTAPEKKGFNTFYEAGCAACHSGAYLGGSQYQRLGLVKAWPDTHDPGRFSVTHNEADRNVFKVPTLRNIDRTGPYYHDGSIATLDEAIAKMGEYQLGRQLNSTEVASIKTYFKALTGRIPTDYIRKPKLPPSTAATPKPVTD